MVLRDNMCVCLNYVCYSYIIEKSNAGLSKETVGIMCNSCRRLITRNANYVGVSFHLDEHYITSTLPNKEILTLDLHL